MSIESSILMKSLVRPFYKQNAGLFAFLIFIMVAAIGRANGVGLLEYHLSLMQAMLTNRPFLLFVLCAWLLYAIKCTQFIVDTLGRKEYGFLSLLSLQRPFDVFRILFGVQFMLLLPVILYAFIALWIGWVHHWRLHLTVIILFFLIITVTGARCYQWVLRNPDKRGFRIISKFFRYPKHSSYWAFLLQYIASSRKLLFGVIKIASCLMLYGLLSGQSGDRTGLQMTLLFYSFGLLGHGVLIYNIRDMEESRLVFYRGLPITLINRFLQYGILYFLIFIPDIIVIEWMAPTHLSYTEAVVFIIFGYSVLLFLNSLLFIEFFKKSVYLKIVTGLYLAIFIALLTGIFPVFSVGLLLLSVYIFFRCYYRFERGV